MKSCNIRVSNTIIRVLARGLHYDFGWIFAKYYCATNQKRSWNTCFWLVIAINCCENFQQKNSNLNNKNLTVLYCMSLRPIIAYWVSCWLRFLDVCRAFKGFLPVKIFFCGIRFQKNLMDQGYHKKLTRCPDHFISKFELGMRI